MFAVRDYIPSKLLDSPTDLEALAIEINCSPRLVLLLIYAPPTSSIDFFKSLTDWMSTFICDNNVLILGDFNLPDVNWSCLNGSTPNSTVLCDFMFNFNLMQLITDPTHIKGNTLDLIITNSPDIVSNISINRDSIISSDHYKVCFDVQSSHHMKNLCPQTFCRDYSKTDMEGLSIHLMHCDFLPCLLSDDIEQIWATIRDVIEDAVHTFTPLVTRKAHCSPTWFSPEIRHKLNCIHSLRKKAYVSRDENLKNKLIVAEHELDALMISEKARYETNLVNDFAHRKNSKIYRYINSILKRDVFPPIMYFNSCSAEDDKSKSSLFNAFFESVYSKNEPFTAPPDEPSPKDVLHNIEFSPDEVFSVLINLDPDKASGCDKISPKVLRGCAQSLYIPLHHLLSLCVSQCSLPLQWKIHRIKPVFKKGDKSEIKNYRPISLLCVTSKVLERLIFDKIYPFLLKRICPAQFGFLRQHSCLQQLLVFLEGIYRCHDVKCQADVIYLDISKAFDRVPHSELLWKLEQMGLGGKLLELIRAYLSQRQQFVNIGNEDSELRLVTSGVPQGSILGPILFIAYINDLPRAIEFSSALIFADDTKCVKKIVHPRDRSDFQSDIDQLALWSLKWKLLFNEDKSAVLHFFQPITPDLPTYCLNGSPIPATCSQKDLGIFLSTNLSWSGHIDYILAKAYKTLNLLRRTFKNNNSVSTKKALYLSLVRSQVTFCSQIWRPHKIKDIIRLENLQRRATKYILHDYISDYKTRLIALKLLPLMTWFEYNDVVFYFSCTKSITERFNIFEYVTFSDRNTRSSTRSTMIHHQARTNSSRHFYFNRLPRIFNALPSFDFAVSVNQIKSHLKKFLWDNFIFNFDPGNTCSFHFLCPCHKCMSSPTPLNLNRLPIGRMGMPSTLALN